jgi:hypothetical protein
MPDAQAAPLRQLNTENRKLPIQNNVLKSFVLLCLENGCWQIRQLQQEGYFL